MAICIPTDTALQHESPTSRMNTGESGLSSMLPQFVRRRLAPFKTVRDIASIYIRPSQRNSSISSIGSSDSILPPPPYSEDPPSSDEDDMDDDFASASSSRPSSSGAATPSYMRDITRAGHTQVTEDVVRYKFANQGLLLVAQSAQELRTNSNANNEYQRRLYLDGITYLLRALPEGLSETEKAGLQAALPAHLKQESPQLLESSTEQAVSAHETSLLSAAVSCIVFWAFYAFALVLPHLRDAMSKLHAFERRHKLGEYMLVQSLAILQITYTQAVAVLCTIWTMNDGIIGKCISAFSLWCAQNVSTGISEGLREATAALQQRRDG